MNSRWFYILLANVAVLMVNIWLFTDKPEVTPRVENATFTPVLPIEEPQNDNVEPALEERLPSVADSFYFMFNESRFSPRPAWQPTPPQQFIDVELTNAQALISEQGELIKALKLNDARQSKQIALLKRQNNRLDRERFMLHAEVERIEATLAENEQTIAQFVVEKERQPPAPLITQNQLIKKSIDAQQDLVVLSSPKQSSLDTDAEDSDALVEEQRFSGSMEFGFKYEQDNQVTRAVNGRLVLDYDQLERYHFGSDLEFEFESEDDVKSTDKYRWQLQSDYNLDPKNTVFARSDISRSKFASYQQEDIFTIGYGRLFFNTSEHKFNLELGPGYRSAVPNDAEEAVSIDEFIIRTRLNYERILTESLQVKVDAVLEAGDSNNVYNFNFKAQNRIYQELYLIFDFEYKYTENVPVDTVNREVASGLGLLYAF